MPDDIQLQITSDGSATLHSKRYQQTFHSHKGALSESRHVFLEHSGVAARLAAGKETHLLEVGFGTGLNFFLSADLALSSGSSLHYSALEQTLLSSDTIRKLGYQQHLLNESLIETFLQACDKLGQKPQAGHYRLELSSQIELTLFLGDATKQELKSAAFDAIYLDAFSPEANPELWSEAFLAKLLATLTEKGVLSSYCVKGEVRRRLAALGFAVQKRPGPPGGKREMLLAAKAAQYLG